MGVLTFGLLWCTFMTFFTMAWASAGEMEPPLKMMLILFWIVGIGMIVTGLVKIILNYITEKFGKVTYGRIKRLYPSGTYVNNKPELKADVACYIEEENKIKTFSEIVGMNPDKYPLGYYVKVKVYKEDINFKDLVNESDVPKNALDLLKEVYITTPNQGPMPNQPYGQMPMQNGKPVELDENGYVKIDNSM